jgi:hypothetical protein
MSTAAVASSRSAPRSTVSRCTWSRDVVYVSARLISVSLRSWAKSGSTVVNVALMVIR